MHQLRLWLADHLIGPRCGFCGERQVGERHLIAHVAVEHAGDREVPR